MIELIKGQQTPETKIMTLSDLSQNLPNESGTDSQKEKQQKLVSADLTPKLAQIPLVELREKVANLRATLIPLLQLIDEQEEELAVQAKLIAQLKTKIKTARGPERLHLEVELANETERWELLEATLVGQRQNLRYQEAIYEQHLQALKQRQNQEATNSSEQEWASDSEEQEKDQDLGKTEKQWWRWLFLLLIIGLGSSVAIALYTMRIYPQQPSISPTSTESPKNRSVSAIGYLEPAGEVIELSASTSIEGVRIEQLLVKQGDEVKEGQIVAILDNRDRLEAALKQAKAQVKVAQARLEQVKAGAKSGDIQAEEARLQRTSAELNGQITSQRAAISSLQAEFQGEKTAQEAGIARVVAELHHAKSDCQRYQQLHQDGAVSVQERDRLCLIQETTEKQLMEARAHLRRIVDSWQERIREAEANLNRTVVTLQRQMQEEQARRESVQEVRSVDVQVAQAELESAQTAVEKARADLDLAYVRAPKQGRILKIHARPGEVVGQRGIFALGQTEQMYVKAEVYETDIRQVRPGQKATIHSNGIVGDLQGIVEDVGLQIGRQTIIDTNPAADVDSRVVEVLIRLSPEDSKTVAGLTNLQVNVVIDTGKNPQL